PLPAHPVIRWRYPTSGGLCASSKDLFGTRTWCGTGWTGQPNVIQHANGSIEVREGAYDDHYHFLNGLTGRLDRPRLFTGARALRRRRLPPLLRRLARHPAACGRDGSQDADRPLVVRLRLAARRDVERRLGRRAARDRRLPPGGRRELLFLRDPAAPPLRRAP